VTLSDAAPTPLASWAMPVCRELVSILAGISMDEAGSFCRMLGEARVIATHGLGREGLVMRAFTMRLFHLGLQATPIGDVTLPAVGEGDLLVVSAGPGAFQTIAALMRIARAAGAKIVLLTAEANAPLRALADLTVVLPARTMAQDAHSMPTIAAALPLGSAFEIALLLFSEHVVVQLSSQLAVDEAAMRRRHTNLE
jgi:6-phospho-3-hexuloisomerase